MNFKNLYRKAFIASVALSPAALLAEETGGSTTGSTFLVDLLSDVKGDMVDALEAAGPYITGVITAGLAIWISIALVGVLKRAFGAGKGR